MDLEILKDQQNPLFKRKEVFAKVKAKSVPSKQEVAAALAEKYKVDANALRVLDVIGKFGVQEFDVRANVYPSKEERDKTERLTKKEKEAEKVPEPAPEEPATETPAESPKEPEAEKTPSEEAIGVNAVEEAKEAEAEKAEEDKKEKDKTPEEKQAE